jgi:hypothetical protein
MKSLPKALGFGLLVWLAPFVVAIPVITTGLAAANGRANATAK